MICLFLWKLGILQEAYNASLTYNLYYSEKNIGNLISGISGGFGNIGIPAWLTLAGFSLAVVRSFILLKTKSVDPLLLFLVFLWPVEIILSSLSGRVYEHYFVSWGPVIAITCGYLFYEIGRVRLIKKFDNYISHRQELILIVLTLVTLFFNWVTALEYRRGLRNLVTRENPQIEKTTRLIEYITKFTDSSDLVLAWGGQTVINYLANRESPTAYTWYPLYVDSPLTYNINTRFYGDITHNKPELVVDAYIDAPLDVPSLNPIHREEQKGNEYRFVKLAEQTPNLQQTYDFFLTHYEFETTITQYDIYRLKDSKWKGKTPLPNTW
jgi:hypothetical protein